MFTRKNLNLKYIMFTILVLFVIWAMVQIKELVILFFGAFVIACSLNPIVDKMEQKMSRTMATTIVLLVSTLLSLLVLLPVVVIAVREFKSLFDLLPDMLRNAILWLKTTSVMGYNLGNLLPNDATAIDSGMLASSILDKSYIITMGIIDGITVICSLLMIVFYLVWEKRGINKSLLKLFPPKMKSRAAEIITNIETKVGGYVFAQFLSMSTVAFFTVIGLLLCNVKYAFLLGIIAGILDIIPIVGPTLAAILGVASATANGWIWIIPTIFVYLTAQWISNQLVRPVVFGKFMQLHPLVVLFSFLVAAKFLGVWGVILAPAIAATILTLFDELYVKVINGKGKNSDE